MVDDGADGNSGALASLFTVTTKKAAPQYDYTSVPSRFDPFFWQLYHLVLLTFDIRVILESKDEDDDDEEGPGLPKKKKKAKTGKRGARKRAEAEAQAAASNGDGTAVEDGGAQQSQEALFKKANDAKNEVKLKEAQEVHQVVQNKPFPMMIQVKVNTQ